MNHDPSLDTLAGFLSDLAKMVIGTGVFALWALLIVGVFG